MKKEQRKTDIKKKKNIEVNPIPKVALRTNGRTHTNILYELARSAFGRRNTPPRQNIVECGLIESVISV